MIADLQVLVIGKCRRQCESWLIEGKEKKRIRELKRKGPYWKEGCLLEGRLSVGGIIKSRGAGHMQIGLQG